MYCSKTLLSCDGGSRGNKSCRGIERSYKHSGPVTGRAAALCLETLSHNHLNSLQTHLNSLRLSAPSPSAPAQTSRCVKERKAQWFPQTAAQFDQTCWSNWADLSNDSAWGRTLTSGTLMYSDDNPSKYFCVTLKSAITECLSRKSYMWGT